MNKPRLKGDMKIYDAIVVMSENDSNSASVIRKLFDSGDSKYGNFMDIMLLDSFGIYGKNIWSFYHDACGENLDKLKLSLAVFLSGEFSEADIKKNLELEHAIPFIDEQIPFDEQIANIDKYVIKDYKAFSDYSKLQGNSFKTRLSKAFGSGESEPGQ